jgi:hypothetical protein
MSCLGLKGTDLLFGRFYGGVEARPSGTKNDTENDAAIYLIS